MNKRFLFFLLQSFFIILQVQAHGDLEKRIIKVTKEIQVSSDSAYLYFKRGKLFFQHDEFKKSIKDLNKSKNLGYQTVEQKLLFAKGYFGLKVYKRTLSICEEILIDDSQNVRAVKVKAQTYFVQGNYYESALAYENLIQNTKQAFPENYIDASHAYELVDNEEGMQKATAIIHKGIENLGELISLYNRLIELSIKQCDYNSAIATQQQIINLSPRKESAYYKLSELYSLNNDTKKAIENLNHAKEYYSKLPARLQNTSFMKDLIDNIKSKETLLQKI